MEKVKSPSATDTLVPPQGAVFKSANNPLGPFTQSVGWTDDKTIQSGTQNASGSATSEYFVYWVNGSNDPYYVVIQRITGSFSPGSMIANGPSSYGFFQVIVGLSSTLVTSDATVTMVQYSPGTFNSGQDNPNAPINLDVNMILQLPSGGGWSPQSFDATEQTTVSVPDWGILDQSASPTLQLSFHQISGCDLLAHPASDWANWYTNIFDLNDNPMDPPSLSTGTLQFEAIAAWTLVPNTSTVPNTKSEAKNPGAAPPAPVSMPITLTTTFNQSLAAWHNSAGCETVFTGSGPLPTIEGAHHINVPSQTFTPSTWSVDLKTFVTSSKN